MPDQSSLNISMGYLDFGVLDANGRRKPVGSFPAELESVFPVRFAQIGVSSTTIAGLRLPPFPHRHQLYCPMLFSRHSRSARSFAALVGNDGVGTVLAGTLAMA
jgi:hypothetical protein